MPALRGRIVHTRSVGLLCLFGNCLRQSRGEPGLGADRRHSPRSHRGRGGPRPHREGSGSPPHPGAPASGTSSCCQPRQAQGMLFSSLLWLTSGRVLLAVLLTLRIRCDLRHLGTGPGTASCGEVKGSLEGKLRRKGQDSRGRRPRSAR